jgi:hypothetical protein
MILVRTKSICRLELIRAKSQCYLAVAILQKKNCHEISQESNRHQNESINQKFPHHGKYVQFFFQQAHLLQIDVNTFRVLLYSLFYQL